MVQVIIVSDTHMPRHGKHLPSVLVDYLEKADLIIHLGDFQTAEIYEMFERYAPIEAVYGNVDSNILQKELPKKKIIAIEGVKIGLAHGHGTGKTTIKRAVDAFSHAEVDLILFGHSHIPYKGELNGRILFNPGSPTDKRRQKTYSFGILTVTEDHFTIDHLHYQSKN